MDYSSSLCEIRELPLFCLFFWGVIDVGFIMCLSVWGMVKNEKKISDLCLVNVLISFSFCFYL